MASLSRKIPLTPLDTLRALLGEYSDGDAAFAGRLLQLLQSLKKQALQEVGGRLSPSASPRGLRKVILGCIAKLDWPEWVPWIFMALQVEPDLGIFDEGCAALGAIGTRDALEALQKLIQARSDPDHQVILNRELGQYQTQHGIGHCLGRLLEGQSNPRLALQGAKLLSSVAGAQDIPAIIEAHRNGDPLAQRLALRALGALPFPASADFLLDLLERTRQEFIDNTQLLAQLNRLHTLPRASTQPELVRQVAAQFGARVPEAVTRLNQAVAREGGDPMPPLDLLRAEAQGVFETFLLDALTLVAEGKVARYSAMLSESSETTEARLLQLLAQCDQVAETLALKVDVGELPLDRILPVFKECLRSHGGGDGFIQAFLRHLPASDTAFLDELRLDPDMGRRERYLDALGTREDDAFTPFFLKAMEDPIVEVGLRAVHHLGKLPSGFPALMSMFETGNVDQVRLAIWVFGENQTRMAAEPLLEFMQKEGRDSLLVAAAEALTAIGYPGSAPVLLELLHDGKPLALQVALAQALKALGSEEASLGLLGKAPLLKQAQVLILALEGALAAFPAFDRPLPLQHLPAFMTLTERCCDEREGEGQRLNAILAAQDLYVFDRKAYEHLKDRFSDFLFDMRTKENWDRDNNDRVAAVIKELGRRSDALGLLAQKEASIQGQVQRLPATGPKRTEALLALRESLQDPELIMRPEIAREMATLVAGQLHHSGAEWRETAHLCEIGGLTHQQELVDPIRDIYQRATGLGLKSAARGALLALGLQEADLNRRAPVRSILLLEPSGFFRKRLANALQGRWELDEAASREEAEAILDRQQVDLLLTESHDGAGDLTPWLEQQWNLNRCRHAIVSTSNRDIGDLAQAPWVIAVLFKPYQMDQVIQALEP
jgi:HEAT repeat protein